MEVNQHPEKQLSTVNPDSLRIQCKETQRNCWDECSTIFISVNNEDWAKTIEESLSDIPKLNEKLDNA